MGFVAHVNRGEGWDPVYLSSPSGETAKVSAHEPPQFDDDGTLVSGGPDSDRQEHLVRTWVPREQAHEFATEEEARAAWAEYLAIQGLENLDPWTLDVEPS